jgi:hypothetical protein
VTRAGVLLIAILIARGAEAQGPPQPGRFELAAVVGWTGSTRFPAADAFEFDSAGDRSRIFSTDSRLAAAPSYGARLGVRMADRVRVEGTFLYASPRMVVHVDEDVEDAPPVDVEERLVQLTVDGGVLVELRDAASRPRTMPFVVGGAAWFRELHDGQTLAANGSAVSIGAGVARIISGGADRGAGVRLEARAGWRRKGAAFDARTYIAPIVRGSLFVRF